MGMPVIKPESICREQVVGDIIESISMEEAALAHILNAESEKLITVINHSDATAEQLMAVNCSVKNTVNAITQLEAILHAKLDLFRQVICE